MDKNNALMLLCLVIISLLLFHSVLRWYRTLIHLIIHTKAQMLSACSCNQVLGWTGTWHWCYCAFLSYYLCIFSSGIVNKILSQISGKLFFPILLLWVGLFTLMYIASLMVLAKLFSSLPIILKFSIDVSWPLLL